MARRRMPGGLPGGMGNKTMMKQIQNMQEEMVKAQEELENATITTTSGGGAVSVTITGAKQVTAIDIDPDVVDEDDIEMLEDLIIAAVNEAIKQVEEMSSKKMERFTGGLNIPGM